MRRGITCFQPTLLTPVSGISFPWLGEMVPKAIVSSTAGKMVALVKRNPAKTAPARGRVSHPFPRTASRTTTAININHARIPMSPSSAKVRRYSLRGLSKRIVQSWLWLKRNGLYRVKSERKVEGPDPQNGFCLKEVAETDQEVLKSRVTSWGN